MEGCRNGADRVNLFALVVYIPDPLARFLDDLRKELTPGCLPRAHVTILPPRSLAVSADDAIQAAQSVVSGFAPFEILLGDVEMFQASEVVYIAISQGARELRELYANLRNGPLSAQEQYPYEPHITLAQDLKPGQAGPIYERARSRWTASPFSRRIRAERAYFVQSKGDGTWADLAEFPLQGVSVAQ